MIEIICDRCERSFTVEDERAGEKVPCPLCGDVNRVPAAGAERGPAPVGPGRPLPPEEGPEQEVCVVRPAMFRAHPFRFVFILLVVGGGLGLAIWGSSRDLAWLGYAGLIPVLFGLLWFGRWWLTAYLWIRITITNKRTIRHEGIVRRHSTEVLHDHVRSVDIRQTFVQRLLNTGYIGIDSAGQDDIEIEIRDIPGPYEIKKIIDRYRAM